MPPIHYVVKSRLVIRKDTEMEFLNLNEEFRHENPIEARDAAFRFYQNYIDVLLEAKNERYFSDSQAREILNDYIFIPGSTSHTFHGMTMEVENSYGNGIGISLIIDQPISSNTSSTSEDKVGEQCLIHAIGIDGEFNYSPDFLMLSLNTEYKYYLHYNLDKGNKTKRVLYCNRAEWEEGFRENEPDWYEIISTPFDWIGKDKPYWWGTSLNETARNEQKNSITIEGLIEGGESNQVEFKSALIFNFKTNKGGIGVKQIVAKAIASFLNGNGGFLLIGVKDDGTIQGLDYDFSLAESKKPTDFFLLEFDQMLSSFLSFSVKDNVSGNFCTVNGKDIFLVTIYPSKRRPIFLKGQNGKEFYIRGEASSRQLTDPEELVNYCLDKWGI